MAKRKESAHQELEDAGFSDEQSKALLKLFARRPHHHQIEDIIRLPEELEEITEKLE